MISADTYDFDGLGRLEDLQDKPGWRSAKARARRRGGEEKGRGTNELLVGCVDALWRSEQRCKGEQVLVIHAIEKRGCTDRHDGEIGRGGG